MLMRRCRHVRRRHADATLFDALATLMSADKRDSERRCFARENEEDMFATATMMRYAARRYSVAATYAVKARSMSGARHKAKARQSMAKNGA